MRSFASYHPLTAYRDDTKFIVATDYAFDYFIFVYIAVDIKTVAT